MTHPRPKTYRRHNCTCRHRTYQTAAKCIWKRAVWVDGEGPYALLAHCRKLTVSLHPTLEAAARDKGVIDGSGCGGACNGHRHEIILLSLPDLGQGAVS